MKNTPLSPLPSVKSGPLKFNELPERVQRLLSKSIDGYAQTMLGMWPGDRDGIDDLCLAACWLVAQEKTLMSQSVKLRLIERRLRELRKGSLQTANKEGQ